MTNNSKAKYELVISYNDGSEFSSAEYFTLKDALIGKSQIIHEVDTYTIDGLIIEAIAIRAKGE